jgi:hypothetical protein
VKNGAELLDRLIKDIVAEKASNYVSTAHGRQLSADGQALEDAAPAAQSPTNPNGVYDDEGEPAFSLPRFIPLLAERIYTLNPFTRMFLVNWISVLDSIPDLELISHLPAFLKGLIQFLSDANDDVRTATQQGLNGFLDDIRRSTDVKKMLKERRRMSQAIEGSDSASGHSRNLPEPATGVDGTISPIGRMILNERLPEDNFEETDDWVPGQDLHIDYSAIIEILIPFLSDSGPSPTTPLDVTDFRPTHSIDLTTLDRRILYHLSRRFITLHTQTPRKSSPLASSILNLPRPSCTQGKRGSLQSHLVRSPNARAAPRSTTDETDAARRLYFRGQWS